MKSTKDLEAPLERAEVAVSGAASSLHSTVFCIGIESSRLGADLTLTSKEIEKINLLHCVVSGHTQYDTKISRWSCSITFLSSVFWP